MPRIVFKLRFTVKQRLLKLVRKCREATCKIKILLLISVSNGRTPQQAADTFREVTVTAGANFRVDLPNLCQ